MIIMMVVLLSYVLPMIYVPHRLQFVQSVRVILFIFIFFWLIPFLSEGRHFVSSTIHPFKLSFGVLFLSWL